jgi:hypothetical protein
MKIRLLTLCLVAWVGSPATAQTAPYEVPETIRSAWAEFTAAWRNGDAYGLRCRVIGDVIVAVPSGTLLGTSALESAWPEARRSAGPVFLPTRFDVLGEHIVERGRAQIQRPADADAEVYGDELFCVPEPAGSALVPATYLREWQLGTDGSWRVARLVIP